MKEIRDPALLEHLLKSGQIPFREIPPVLRILEFQKGELLNHPLKPLDQFLMIAEGSISIYDLAEDGSIRYVSQVGSGTLLGDIEFSQADGPTLYTEAAEHVLCLAIPFRENRCVLENDPVFLRFVLRQFAKKLTLSATMDATAQTLEERVLFYLRKIQPTHEIRSVNVSLKPLHCSRRQLQRILKKLCDRKILEKTGRGCYHLLE